MPPKQSKSAAAAKDADKAPAKTQKAAASTKAKTGTKATAASKTASKDASKPAPKSVAKAETATSPPAKKSAAKAKPAAATAKKTAAAEKTSPPKKAAKRRLDDEVEEEEGAGTPEHVPNDESRPQKKARVTATEKPPRKMVLVKRPKSVAQNQVPTAALDVFVFGEGSSGELGLGSKKFEGKKPIDVKRPRLNHNLKDVVDLACGGMHAVALTKDNRVLTWGVNDDKALGRDTTWDGGVRDVDAEESDDDDDDDTGVNPLESTPTEIQKGELQDSDIICKVAATDSATFVLTTNGFVFGWGTFRGADGIIGFSKDAKVQPTPVLIAPLKDITNIACGSNHVMAVDVNGKVWTWGSGGQFQLGRKPVTRHGGPTTTLQPQPCGMFGKRHFAVDIAAGSYHSFYIDNEKRVWSWGLNNYSQTGHFEDTGKDDAMILQPRLVDSLKDADVRTITGGEHHSVARTHDGKLLTWGRVDGHQVGHPSTLFTEDNAMFDENKKPRILLEPTAVPDVNATFVAAGVDTSFAIDTTGHVYSWGFSANYQTGQGTTDDIEVPTVIDNTAIRDRTITWAGAGGQYSMLAAKRDSSDKAKEE